MGPLAVENSVIFFGFCVVEEVLHVVGVMDIILGFIIFYLIFMLLFVCGQTSRPLHKRISEHERYTRPAYSHATDLQQSSALAQHAHASGHQIDFSSATILAKLQHQQQLDLVEHAAITILEPSLNRNHAAPSINPQWHPILQSISDQFHPISIT